MLAEGADTELHPAVNIAARIEALAEAGGWVRPFAEAGQPMTDLLRHLADQNGMVAAIGQQPTFSLAPGGPSGLDPADLFKRSTAPANRASSKSSQPSSDSSSCRKAGSTRSSASRRMARAADLEPVRERIQFLIAFF